MRGYDCYIYHKVQLGNEFLLYLNNNQACWAGLNWYIKNNIKTIYVSRFEEPETRIYQQMVVDCINKITPCRIVHLSHPRYQLAPNAKPPNGPQDISVGTIIPEEEQKDKCPYIKINLLKTYNQCLVVFNFLRSLWSEPKKGYSYTLFDTLKQTDPNDDALVRLTKANIPACQLAFKKNVTYEGDHCNLYRNTKVRTSEDLFKWEGTSVRDFIA